MDIYIFSDESGVFDNVHNDIFVFGGIIFFSKEHRDICARKYIHAERTLRESGKYTGVPELKASAIRPGDRSKLFRSVAQYKRFGIVIHQKKLQQEIFDRKKNKQRYLDYAYKIGLKRLLKHLIEIKEICADKVENIYVCADEHSTATSGLYELREALEQEFKFGTFNYKYSKFFPPIFSGLKNVTLSFCNSAKKPLIRASDIIANKLYYVSLNNPSQLHELGIFVVELP